MSEYSGDDYYKGYLRPMLAHLKKNYKIPSDGLIGAEIGVKGGTHASFVLVNLPIKMLYLIDPYKRYDGIDTNYDLDVYLNDITNGVLKRFDNAKLIRKMSSDAVDDLPDELDFVYIDGNHHLDYVNEDIENYYKKVKIGGYIGGHDYDDITPDNQVKVSVDYFCHKNSLQVMNKAGDDPYTIKRKGINDWWVIKQ